MMRTICSAVPLLPVIYGGKNGHAESTRKMMPNIPLILTDDMGYVDSGGFKPGSNIFTPNVYILPNQKMEFMDSHGAGPCFSRTDFTQFYAAVPLLY